MLKRNNIVVLTIIVIMSCSYADNFELEKEILTYIQMIKAEPSLANLYIFYGEGNENELVLALRECERRGWKPGYDDEKCNAFLRGRKSKTINTPSLYLLWLGGMLPEPKAVRVMEVKQYRDKDVLHHDLITAEIDGVRIVLFRPVHEHDQTQFGELSVSSIDGESVSVLFSKYLGEK